MGKNIEHNKMVFELLEEVKIGKSVFSRDGFIEYQNGLSEIKFGDVAASYGACGAIAVWNILKSFNIAPDKAQVFDDVEKGAILGGRLGTNVFFIKKYLSGRGHRINMYFCLNEFKRSFAAAGIVYYINDNFKAHYVAFTPAGVNEKGEKLYRFHNAAGSYWKAYNGVKYVENIPMTIEEFLEVSNAKVKVFYDVR